MKRRFGKLLAILLAIPLLIGTAPVRAFAAQTDIQEYNAAVLARKQSIEETFGIRISYPQKEGKRAGIGTGTLATLETCLNYLGAGPVRQISAFYEEYTGRRLSIDYTHTYRFYEVESGRPVASFNASKALIEIYAPLSSANEISSGSSPLAIIHELGHAAHLYFMDKVGAGTLEKNWTALNGTARYRLTEGAEKSVFASDYAALDYDEDFAETFAHAFVCDRAGFSIARQLKTSSGKATPLGNKVAYLEQLISKHFSKPETALKSISNIRSTPATVSYRGYNFSGNALEYRGFNAPTGILNGILSHTGIDAADTVWDKSIGGWVITDTKGREYLVFPGGQYTKL